jgi:hypothetical protein
LKLGLNNPIKSNELKLKKLIGEIQFSDVLFVDDILENDQFFFVSIQQGFGLYVEGEIHRFLYNKASDQLTNLPYLINDIDGGMPFWPDYQNNNNSELIAVHNSFEIIENIQAKSAQTDQSEKFLTVANGLNENDNPVLMLVKLNK